MIPKCKKCLLFDKDRSVCNVGVFIEGEKYELPVNKEDDCHWILAEIDNDEKLEQAIRDCPFQDIKSSLVEESKIPLAIQSVKVWDEGKDRKVEYSC